MVAVVAPEHAIGIDSEPNRHVDKVSTPANDIESAHPAKIESDNSATKEPKAMVKVRVGAEVMHTAAEGNGPVNALDQALRKSLLQFYPSLAAVKLIDYKVRILEESTGTASQVRVLIESSDGVDEWRTVGSSTNIIEASWLALADSLEYWLLKKRANQ